MIHPALVVEVVEAAAASVVGIHPAVEVVWAAAASVVGIDPAIVVERWWRQLLLR